MIESADKRSIDAYGRSVELAIANYLLDNGDFSTDISNLSVEYSGDRVECSTTQLNNDSSVYLAGCTVGGRSVEGYTYESDKSQTYSVYNVGDEVTYNGVDYYVIKNSGVKEPTITLLKAEPLTLAEVNQYGGVGTDNNYVNLYACGSYDSSCHQTAYKSNGYEGMSFHSNQLCGFIGSDRLVSGCNHSYSQSDIKYVVDAWSVANTNVNDLVANFTGYKYRLITIEELTSNIGYGEKICEGYDEAWGDSIRECILKKMPMLIILHIIINMVIGQ